MLPLSFSCYCIDLRLHHSVRLHFRHEVMLHSLFSEALGKGELPGWVVPFACESGRVDFERDEVYRIGVTVVRQNADRDIDGVVRALRTYGSRGFQGDRIPMLRWFAVENVTALPPIDLGAEVARLEGAARLVLHFVSPLRMEIPREDGATETREAPRFFDAAHFPANEFLRLSWNRFFFLAEGRHPNRAESLAGVPRIPPLSCDARELLWMEIPRVTKAPLAGACGRVTIDNPGELWLEYLAAGQYVHVGKSTGFGFGAYRIAPLNAQGAPLWNDGFGPSHTALERAATHDRLVAAAHRVAADTEAGGSDGMRPAELARDAETIAGGAARALRDGSYRAAPLLGMVIRKDGSKVRALAVPTLTDRMIQRAVLEVVGPAVETLLEDCSFGYRKGFSRAGAARAIEKAYAEGFRYVLDADVDSFFDAVDWPRLFAKLDALYPFEPLVATLRTWVTAPVVFQGKIIERTRGLPQGAVVSPLLANLFLDELDEELLRDDFRLVRYADDFVVLCKDRESAERAHEEARAALARLGLSLQEEKTAVVSMDHGFTYLGYLFCRSAAVEHHDESRKQKAEGRSGSGAVPDVVADHPIVAQASWLAGVDLSRIRTLDAHAPAPSAPELIALHGTTTSPPPDGRRPLYVSDPGVYLHLRDDTVVIEKDGDAPRRIPLRTLSQVVFIGRPRATLPLVLEMGIAGIPLFFCRRNGELEAVHGPFQPDAPTWIAQARASEDGATRLAFAQEIVAAKLHNYATIAVRHSLHGHDAVAGAIRELERSVWNKTEIDSVRGVEGAAAVLWFGAVRETLAAEWEFDGRVKHPPRGPFNAMLSFGYTLLHHHCAASLWAAGLVPRIGLYHREHGDWAALASDRQEEFRYLVDGMVWAMVRRNEIRPAEFDRRDEGCWLTNTARRRFIETFEQRLETTFRPEGVENPVTYREAIGAQAARIRELVLGRARYEAVRAHS